MRQRKTGQNFFKPAFQYVDWQWHTDYVRAQKRTSKKRKGNLNTQIFIDSIGSSQPEEKCHHAAAAKDINTKYYIQ